MKERTESVDGQLEDINEQIKVCLSKFSHIAPISTIPMLTTEEGEFRIEHDDGDFDDIDEAAAADFKTGTSTYWYAGDARRVLQTEV